jgi:hypothetical protein
MEATTRAAAQRSERATLFSERGAQGATSAVDQLSKVRNQSMTVGGVADVHVSVRDQALRRDCQNGRKPNAVTGEAQVSRFLGSFDAGRILNPRLATSQFRGGILMGFGLALTEETPFDERNGQIMNPSLAEYHVPVHLDVQF